MERAKDEESGRREVCLDGQGLSVLARRALGAFNRDTG